MKVRKILCYRRGCNHVGRWTVPGNGSTILHLCDRCLRALFPKAVRAERIVIQAPEEEGLQVHVGPSEFKQGEGNHERQRQA